MNILEYPVGKNKLYADFIKYSNLIRIYFYSIILNTVYKNIATIMPMEQKSVTL